jgi:hypothetical protein
MPVRALLSQYLTILLGASLVIITDVTAILTRYHGVEYTSPLFKNNPQNAIVLIQIFASLALIVTQYEYYQTTHKWKWAMCATGRDVDAITFIALGGTVDLHVIRFLISSPKRLFVSKRFMAIVKILMHISTLVAGFIWLLNIDSRMAYKVSPPDREQTNHTGIGDFNFTLGGPWPYLQFDMTDYLNDGTRVIKVDPTICSPNSFGTCHAYVIFPRPINYTYACVVGDSQCERKDNIIVLKTMNSALSMASFAMSLVIWWSSWRLRIPVPPTTLIVRVTNLIVG